MSRLRALVFDLYGTLLHVRDTGFQRGVARLVRAPRGRWSQVLRDVLLVQPFADRDAFVGAALASLDADPALAPQARDLLDRELASVEPEASLRSILGFWKRRGLRLGLLTNSGSPFREPVAALGLSDLFEAMVFSCDEGLKKPAPEIYQRALERLAAGPDETLMIGDSLANDVLAAEAVGMRGLLIGTAQERAGLARFEQLAWLDLGAADRAAVPSALVAVGAELRLGERAGTLRSLDVLADGVQGRYNLVGAAGVEWADGTTERLYLKRFRHPEAVWVEECMHAALALVGIATCEVAVLPGSEPLLLSAAAPGSKMDVVVPEPDLVFEIGRHGASAYLLANADLRPRNSFLSRADGGLRLTMVDYEYSLFSPALDLSAEPGRFDPHALARLGEANLVARIERRVVSPGAIKRTRRAFFDARVAPPEVLAAFRAGWHDVHQLARRNAGAIADLLYERGKREPYLVIGTEAYRRAFLPLDVRDILERIAGDPDEACSGAL